MPLLLEYKKSLAPRSFGRKKWQRFACLLGQNIPQKIYKVFEPTVPCMKKENSNPCCYAAFLLFWEALISQPLHQHREGKKILSIINIFTNYLY
jgi:hypothetical protein